MGVVLAIVVFGVAAFGYLSALEAYPYTIPLQSGTVAVDPLPKEAKALDIEFKEATYDVPGRSMRIKFAATNTSDKPLTLGEFTTANLRFVDHDVPDAVAGVDSDFPRELVPRAGLKSSVKGPLAPGDTREFDIAATDAAWELERLTSFLTDVDSKMGGMLVFYDDEGKRHLAEISGAIIPRFLNLGDSQEPKKVSGGSLIP
jgi:methane/ammonia monooxygenase subunit B